MGGPHRTFKRFSDNYVTMKNKRESPPPSRWGKSKGGLYFYLVHSLMRSHRGEKLYRLKFPEGVTSSQFWTLNDLNEEGVRWLKRKPSCFTA